MALQTMINRLNKAKKNYEKELKALGKNAQKEIAQTLAEFIPEGFALHWDQYTDYFNDGEPCTFSVHDPLLVTVKLPREVTDESVNIPAGEGHHDHPVSHVIDRECEERAMNWSECREGEPGCMLLEYFDADWNKGDDRDPFFDGVTIAQLKKLRAAWRKLPEDLLERAFGDHVTVRIYSNGKYQTEECEHD